MKAEIMNKMENELWIDTSEQVAEEMKEMSGNEETGKTICKVTTDGDWLRILELHFYEGETKPDSVARMILPIGNAEYMTEEDGTLTIRQVKGSQYEYIGFDLCFAPLNEQEEEVGEEARRVAEEFQKNKPKTEKARLIWMTLSEIAAQAKQN